ncbi:hypothetical protein BH10PSE18_BH10PSE18_41040 [soil metagenome]
MCLDVLRAIARNPDDARLVFGELQQIASQDVRVLAQLQQLSRMADLPPAELERQARRFTQKLALTTQACLMLAHASAEASDAFIASRFDPDWGAVGGITSGSADPAALLRAAWA